MGRKKKFVVEIDEKYIDQKKPPNGYVHNREQKNKNCRTLIAKKKDCLLSEVKKKFASNKNSSPPPPRYLMVRPLVLSKAVPY